MYYMNCYCSEVQVVQDPYLHTPLVEGLLHEVGLVKEPLGYGLGDLPVVCELDGLVFA